MDSLVSTDWLAGELGAADLAVIDASAHLPAAGRDPRGEFEAGHIPSARFLDLPTLKDAGSPVPGALPTAEQFAARMRALGVAPDARVVLYDDSALKTSARAWLMFRMGGPREATILDGGLAKWKAEGRPLEGGTATTAPPSVRVERRAKPAVEIRERGAGVSRLRSTRTEVGSSISDIGPGRVRSKAEMLANLASRAEQVLDARDAARFSGETADTVHGLPGGHIPGARNLPYSSLFEEDGTYKSPAELRRAFEAAGIDLARPIVTSCGSGATASVLLFALHRLGKADAALYDGSWSEWGADPATPKEMGVRA